MKKADIILLICSLISACSTGSSKDVVQADSVFTDTTSIDYKPLKLKRIYIEMQGRNEMSGFTHFVVTENYRGDGDNFLVKYADEYLDTCKSYLPVWQIIFCKPFDFTPTFDSEDLKPLFSHALIGIGYMPDTIQRKFPDIESVTFWKDGKPTYVQLNTIDRRKEKLKK